MLQFSKTVKAIQAYLQIEVPEGDYLTWLLKKRRDIIRAFSEEYDPLANFMSDFIAIEDASGRQVCTVSYVLSTNGDYDIILHIRQHRLFVGTTCLKKGTFTPRL